MKKALSSIKRFFVGLGNSIIEARMEQAKFYAKHRMWG